MKTSRFFFHSLANRRAARFLGFFSGAAAILAAVTCWRLQAAARALSLDPETIPAAGRVLLSPYFQGGVIMIAGLISTGIASRSCSGPIRRMEDWLAALAKQADVPPLRLRRGDALEPTVRLLNSLASRRRARLSAIDAELRALEADRAIPSTVIQ